MPKSISLAEFAADYLDPQRKDNVRWLRTRIKRGELRAHRDGRSWRMTKDDLAENLDRLSNRDLVTAADAARALAKQITDQPSEVVSIGDGLSARSRRLRRGTA